MQAHNIYQSLRYRWLLLLMLGWFQLAHAAPLPQVEIHTNHGIFTVELNIKKAPKSVENFLNYARSGFYQQSIFHRVIKSYMIQGGGFTVNLDKKLAKTTIINEADNGLNNVKGSIVVARRASPHSGSSQFFINLKDNPILNHRNKTHRGWGFAVFGQVIAGMDVLENIEKSETSSQDKFKFLPLEPIIITNMIIYNDISVIKTIENDTEEANIDAEISSENDSIDDEDTTDEQKVTDDIEIEAENVDLIEVDSATNNSKLLPEYSPEPPDVPAVE